MKTVYLVCGPRGAGKTTALKEFRKTHPEVRIISRDALALRLYDTVYPGSYTTAPWHLYSCMERSLKRSLLRGKNHIIMDTWTGTPAHMFQMAIIAGKALSKYADARVVCIFFTTPIEQVREWFWKKPEVMKTSLVTNSKKIPRKVGIFEDNEPEHDYQAHQKLLPKIYEETLIHKVILFDPTTQKLKDVITLNP